MPACTSGLNDLSIVMLEGKVMSQAEDLTCHHLTLHRRVTNLTLRNLGMFGASLKTTTTHLHNRNIHSPPPPKKN